MNEIEQAIITANEVLDSSKKIPAFVFGHPGMRKTLEENAFYLLQRALRLQNQQLDRLENQTSETRK
jgi:hypothetical protein